MSRVIVAIVCLALSSSGCNKTAPIAPAKKGPWHVVATTGMVADIARNIGGEHVRVTQLLGPGVDPHLYKPTRDDVKTIMSADIVMYSGLMLEGKMADTFAKVGNSKPVWAVTELISPLKLLQSEEDGGHYDPHVWNNVLTWSQCASFVGRALNEFDPSNSTDYEANRSEYCGQLQKLHNYGVETIGSVPQENRVLVTSHDAFNYFGKAYQLEVMGIQGLSTESEAGLQRINELVDILVEKNVKAVFVESSVPRKSIEALVDGAKSRDHEVKVGGELYSDAMGELGTYTGTYIGMMDHNIYVVAKGLGGNVPEGGFSGKLKSD